MSLKAIKALEELIGVALENLAAPTARAATERKLTAIPVENMAWCHQGCHSSGCCGYTSSWASIPPSAGPMVPGHVVGTASHQQVNASINACMLSWAQTAALFSGEMCAP